MFSSFLDHIDSVRTRPITLAKDVVPKVEALTGITYQFVAVELDEDISLGHVRPVADSASPKGWSAQVRFSNKLNFCWGRYVCCKEVMHAFDRQGERVNTEEKLAKLVTELAMPLPVESRSEIYASERRTMWMALAALCPKRLRDKYRSLYEKGDATAYDVAVALRVPEQYMRTVLSPDFDEIEKTLRMR